MKTANAETPKPEPRSIEAYDSVWDAITDTPEQVANLRARAELMRRIARIVNASGSTQAEAALRRAVTQPRINDLLRGRVSRFSIDALVNIGVPPQPARHRDQRRPRRSARAGHRARSRDRRRRELRAVRSGL